MQGIMQGKPFNYKKTETNSGAAAQITVNVQPPSGEQWEIHAITIYQNGGGAETCDVSTYDGTDHVYIELGMTLANVTHEPVEASSSVGSPLMVIDNDCYLVVVTSEIPDTKSCSVYVHGVKKPGVV